MVHFENLNPLKTDETGTSFMVAKLGSDAGPMKQYRELTVNSFEAIEALLKLIAAGQIVEPNYKPQIRIQYDPFWEEKGWEKYCHIDNGIGMTGEELESLWSHLFRSTKLRTIDGNYGAGAKIATATFNPYGVEVRSWKDGIGHRIILRREDSGTGESSFGLHRFPLTDSEGNETGEYKSAIEIDDEDAGLMKAKEIDQHGTMVILLGKTEKDNTLIPEYVRGEKGRGKFWSIYFLNRTFFEIPHGIEMHTGAEPEYATGRGSRKVSGYRVANEDNKTDGGVAPIHGANVHWWILKGDTPEERKAIKVRTTQYYPSMANAGSFSNFAMLYRGELYDFMIPPQASVMLKQFGIIAGWHNVALYVEPTIPVVPNVTRTHLQLGINNNDPLPIEEWAAEFSQNLPPALAQHVQSHMPDGMVNVDEYVAEQVKRFAAGLPMRRPMAKQNGQTKALVEVPKGGHSGEAEQRLFHKEQNGDPDPEPDEREPRWRDPEAKSRTTRRQNLLFGTAKGGVPAQQLNATERMIRLSPKVSFHPATDRHDDMYERAGRYVQNQGVLFMNSAFRHYRDHLDYARSLLAPDATEDEEIAKYLISLVQSRYASQAALAVVTALHSFKNDRAWSPGAIEDMLSPQSLTLAVSDIRPVRDQITREIGRNPLTKRFYLRRQEELEAAA